jgi:hypothetical protein
MGQCCMHLQREGDFLAQSRRAKISVLDFSLRLSVSARSIFRRLSASYRDDKSPAAGSRSHFFVVNSGSGILPLFARSTVFSEQTWGEPCIGASRNGASRLSIEPRMSRARQCCYLRDPTASRGRACALRRLDLICRACWTCLMRRASLTCSLGFFIPGRDS